MTFTYLSIVLSLGLLASSACAFLSPDAAQRSRSTFVVSRPSFPMFVAAEAAAKEGEIDGSESERHTIFVGNLPFDSSDDDVRELFSEFGTVAQVNLPKNKDTNSPRGFAFVDMSNQEELETAISRLDGADYRSRSLKVTKSIPKDQLEKNKPPRRQQSSSPSAGRSQPADGTKKVYVGNLPFGVQEDDLVELFQECGQILDFFLPVDRETGAKRGFCFVTMSEEDADKMIAELNGQEFQGRRLTVNVPLPPGERRVRGGEDRGRGGGRGGSGGNRDQRTKLYVGNLSFYTVADTLRELFEEFGPVHDCYLPEDTSGNGGSRGFGFVTMDKEAALQAIEELDGCEIDGRQIRVNAAQAKRF